MYSSLERYLGTLVQLQVLQGDGSNQQLIAGLADFPRIEFGAFAAFARHRKGNLRPVELCYFIDCNPQTSKHNNIN